ncbi:MAG TPA: VWA domain-containing protein [Acidobacteriaceae bacterium]|nr:VWA domain-containing protein [Acidobacteriaceae bacterium]
MRGAGFSALSLLFLGVAFGQQSVPNAPAPQSQSQTQPQTQAPAPNAPVPNTPAPKAPPLSQLKNDVVPGKGAGIPDDQTFGPANAGQTAPHIESGIVQAPQGTPPPDQFQKTPPMMPKPGEAPVPPPPPPAATDHTKTFIVHTTVVDVPVTVMNKHHQLVAGLPWWRFHVYDNGVRQRIWYFTTGQYPLSIALVIDDTLPADVMQKVNQSLSVIAGSLTPADSVAIVTYAGTSPELVTDFTGAEGARLPAALTMAQRPGQEMGVPIVDGPFAQGPTVNGQPADPTLEPQQGNMGGFLVLPHEAHPLNDAILYAAEQLASQPPGRRRIIYVVSDGRNVRSKATYKEVVQYLLTNNISVYGAGVGDASLWGIGYLDRAKIPFLQPDDLLPRYALDTGGIVLNEFSENGMQDAFTKIADSVRTAYTIDYISHQSTLSGSCHSIEVRVEGIPDLIVNAKQAYCPAATPEY